MMGNLEIKRGGGHLNPREETTTLDLAETGDKPGGDDEIASAVRRVPWKTDFGDYYYSKELEETAKSHPKLIDFLGVGST